MLTFRTRKQENCGIFPFSLENPTLRIKWKNRVFLAKSEVINLRNRKKGKENKMEMCWALATILDLIIQIVSFYLWDDPGRWVPVVPFNTQSLPLGNSRDTSRNLQSGTHGKLKGIDHCSPQSRPQMTSCFIFYIIGNDIIKLELDLFWVKEKSCQR